MKLTVQQLANICMHSWEIERELGFHMSSQAEFQKYVAELQANEARSLMENLSLLFRTIRELGQIEISLIAGHPVDPMLLPPCNGHHTNCEHSKCENTPTGEAPKQPE